MKLDTARSVMSQECLGKGAESAFKSLPEFALGSPLLGPAPAGLFGLSTWVPGWFNVVPVRCCQRTEATLRNSSHVATVEGPSLCLDSALFISPCIHCR